MVYGVWCMVYVVYGVWCMVCGARPEGGGYALNPTPYTHGVGGVLLIVLIVERIDFDS